MTDDLTAILTRALGGDPAEPNNLLRLRVWADSMEEARTRPSPASSLEGDIRTAINRHSVESGSSTPDFILAEYLLACLHAFDAAINMRESWHGRASRTCIWPFMPAPGRSDPYGEMVCEQHGADCVAAEVVDSRTPCDRCESREGVKHIGQGFHLCAACAGAGGACCDRIEALDCDLAEARAELAAERGEAAGALPGWGPSWLGDDIPAYQGYMGGDPAAGSRVLWAERDAMRVSDDWSAPRSIVWRWGVDDCETGETIHTGTAPTAREAMRAAELAHAR